MTTTVPSWAALLAAGVPRPRTAPGENDTLGADLLHGKRGWYWQGSWGPSAPVFPSVAAALCQIEAVKWLAAERWNPKVSDNRWSASLGPMIDPPFEAMLFEPDHPDADEDTGYRIFGADTFDEALRTACASIPSIAAALTAKVPT